MTQHDGPVGRWTEDDSEVYARLAPVAIPARDEQIATIVALLPFDTDAHFTVLDLGAGEGALSFAIMETSLGSSETQWAVPDRFQRTTVRPAALRGSRPGSTRAP